MAAALLSALIGAVPLVIDTDMSTDVDDKFSVCFIKIEIFKSGKFRMASLILAHFRTCSEHFGAFWILYLYRFFYMFGVVLVITIFSMFAFGVVIDVAGIVVDFIMALACLGVQFVRYIFDSPFLGFYR